MSVIVPAGYAGGNLGRKACVPASDLEQAFLKFHKLCAKEKYFARACVFAERFQQTFSATSSSIDEVHSLVLKYCDSLDTHSGLFVSAVYRSSPDSIILYNMDVPIHYVGFCLPEDKLFANRGRLGHDTGGGANGVVVNLGTVKSATTINGLFVNAGTVEGMLSPHSGTVISLREVGIYWESLYGGTMIRHTELSQELRVYLEEVADVCSGQVDGIHARYGPVPAERIRTDVCRLLGAEE